MRCCKNPYKSILILGDSQILMTKSFFSDNFFELKEFCACAKIRVIQHGILPMCLKPKKSNKIFETKQGLSGVQSAAISTPQKNGKVMRIEVGFIQYFLLGKSVSLETIKRPFSTAFAHQFHKLSSISPVIKIIDFDHGSDFTKKIFHICIGRLRESFGKVPILAASQTAEIFKLPKQARSACFKIDKHCYQFVLIFQKRILTFQREKVENSRISGIIAVTLCQTQC